jgi:hypothetical protein
LPQAAHPFPACSLSRNRRAIAADASAGERTRLRCWRWRPRHGEFSYHRFILRLLTRRRCVIERSGLDVER